MKNVNKLAVLLSLGALAPFAASAKTLEQSYLESCNKAPGVPVPVSVVSPTADSDDIGQEVDIVFVVDSTGHTTDVSVKSGTDKELAASAVDAVKHWRFTPAQVNGAPVATKCVLPIRVVEPTVANSFAVN
jgi:TonB family protein